MNVSISTQVKLAKNVIPLVHACEGSVAQLERLRTLCEIVDECAEDEHSITTDLMEYVQECLDIAKGQGDPKWRDELYEVLQDDMRLEDEEV